MGLESSDPWVLRYCVNKQMTLDDFQRALAMLKKHDLLAYANVSLGTAFLTENEAIQDAVSTVRWALSQGVDKVVLFPLHVKEFTVLHQLWMNGLHHPTSLWSLAEVLRRLGNEAAARVEIAWYKPLPLTEQPPCPTPTTCGMCEEKVVGLLDAYKKTMNFTCIESVDETDALATPSGDDALQPLPQCRCGNGLPSPMKDWLARSLGRDGGTKSA